MTNKRVNQRIPLPSHKTKIICTIGPASRPEAILESLMRNGMNVARLNFSFGTLREHRDDIRHIKKIATELNQNITILIDLPGSKIRIGKLTSEPLLLKKNTEITLTTEDIMGTATRIPVKYQQLASSVSKGKTVYFSDGFIQLKVKDILHNEVVCKVITGGSLYSSKGVNLPGAKVHLDSVTKQDLELVDFGLQQGVNTFGISFIQNADDIEKVKEFGQKKGKRIRTVAKIERKEAVHNFGEILRAADGIMIARGDLGLEIPLEQVPLTQKRLIRRANIAGRPVITATQMLESMKDNTRPTRAEVADVANAILDGTDAVMLSEETAVGHYPLETVMMMRKIATAIEQRRGGIRQSGIHDEVQRHTPRSHVTVTDIISLNVVEAAEALNVRYILSPTASGNTARRISRFKPSSWVFAFSRAKDTCDFLSFSYGVIPFLMKNRSKSWHGPILRFLQEKKFVKNGDKIILTQRRFTKRAGGTDSFGIITIEKEMK
jgi:pyruvate kinase